MIDISIKSDLDKITRNLTDMARKQLPFATARALTSTAKIVKQALPAYMDRELDKPTQFTKRGIFVKPANKKTLAAVVGFMPKQAEYMKYQIAGGVRQPKKRAQRLPTAVNLDAFGNLPRGIIARMIEAARAGKKLTRAQGRKAGISNKLDIFYGDPGNGMPPGIYKRVPGGRTGRGSLIPVIVFPRTAAHYKPRFKFKEHVTKLVQKNFPAEFNKSMQEAMRTAR